jgi:hypothetical protein
MPAITITVPPEQREDLHHELLAHYGVKAEAIYHAVDHHLKGEEPIQSLLRHRQELAAIDALIDQLGWRPDTPAATSELTGDADLLRRTVHAALASAAEELRDLLETATANADEIDTVARELRRVTALFELLRTVYAEAS